MVSKVGIPTRERGNEEKKILVPKLRFPEFRGTGEWEPKNLGDNDVSEFVKKREALNKLDIETFVSTENILPDFGGIKTSSKLPTSGSFTAYVSGDVLIANIRPYLKKVWLANRSGGASNDVVVVRPKTTNGNTLLPFLLKNEVFINYVMEGAKGVKMPRGDISLMKKYRLALPGPEEQQKIADCLSSIDTLITLQTQKLDALKAHKKALMQQLFPANGETIPKLRFPEFRDAGEWVENTLEQVANYENGKAHEQDIDDQGRYIVANSKFVSTEGEVKKFSNAANLLAKKNDILMVLSDVPNGRAIAKCFYVDKDNTYTVNQRICRFTAKENAVSLMLLYILDRNAYFLTFDDGVKQTNLKKDDVLNCPVFLPDGKEEQQKIADCLFSIDALVTAQTEKIDILKAHKKGLMQQLFPSPGEIGA